MTPRPLIAVLAGARETRDAVDWLARTPAQAVVIWAPGSEPVPLGLPVATELPLAADGILDVTHAFDAVTRAHAVAQLPHAPYARIIRVRWTPGPGDDWREVDTMADAVDALPRGARVFAATGRESLGALARHDGPVFLRQLTRHEAPTGHPNCTYIFGTAPFDATGEVELFERLRIGAVLARNVGGAGSFPKLAAARALGLPVVLLRPPPPPPGVSLGTESDVADWVAGL